MTTPTFPFPVYKTDSVELRLGPWQTVLADVTADALITDAPYSEKTHEGHNEGADTANEASAPRVRGNKKRQELGLRAIRRQVEYECFTPEIVDAFVDSWAPRVRGWFVSITDHVLAPHWLAALERRGRYGFAPLPFVETGSRVRLVGDGPSNWTCWTVVARPSTREFQRWGTLQGAYVDTREIKHLPGGKPLGLMRAVIRDYTRPGDLIVDPCAGAATTLLAAAIEGRRAIGAELDPRHFEIACARLRKGFTPCMFADNDNDVALDDLDLDDDAEVES